MSIYKLDWYTLMYNEADIIPYVVDYWQKLRDGGIDLHVYVHDNYSTDNSVNLLKDIPWITIRQFKSDGQNDVIQAQIKNSCWMESRGRADFVCVSDFDEILWGDLASELEVMKTNGYNVMATDWYAFCGTENPVYTPGMFLHQLLKRGYRQHINHQPGYGHLGKFMVINPNKVDTMNWSVGNHISNPQPYMNLYKASKVVAFHVNKGLSEDYFVQKRQKMNKRLSDTNKAYGMCIEYGYSEERIRMEYQGYQKESIDISEL